MFINIWVRESEVVQITIPMNMVKKKGLEKIHEMEWNCQCEAMGCIGDMSLKGCCVWAKFQDVSSKD